MTTIVAIIACYLFYGLKIVWAFFVVFNAGLIQFVTKNAMNKFVRKLVAEGQNPLEASHQTSNGLTIVNMLSTFVIWGFLAYSLWVKFV